MPFVVLIQNEGKEARMTEAELQEFLAAMDEVVAEHSASKRKARKFLVDGGFLNEDGGFTVQYSALEQDPA